MNRVMVTGLGFVTALGEGVTVNWKSLVYGRTAVQEIRGFCTTGQQAKLGAEINDFDPQRHVAKRSLKISTRGDQLAVAASALALSDAGLDGEELHSAGLYLGSHKDGKDDMVFDVPEGMENSLMDPDGGINMRTVGRELAAELPPLAYVKTMQHVAMFLVSSQFGLRGPNCFYVGAADAGAAAVSRAARSVRRGETKVALCGGFGDAPTRLTLPKISSFGLLTERNDLGNEALRPFDRNHSGSVLGEGSVILVLEDRERALKRGARCYAEITGSGWGNDCIHPLETDPKGRGLSGAITRSLCDAGQSRVDYVVAHGDATAKGDLSETQALHSALGTQAERVEVSSVKPQTGHLLGAAGALNVAVAALALHTGTVPPTINHETPAPGCDLDFVPRLARESAPAVALALARGLEGQAVSIALARAS